MNHLEKLFGIKRLNQKSDYADLLNVAGMSASLRLGQKNSGCARMRRGDRQMKRACLTRVPQSLQSISVISRLRLVTSSFQKIAWTCFFTIGKLRQA